MPTATRILFEGKRAVGVEYRQGKELKQIRARREVIVSSGAFQTPHLLMLSGVGDSAELQKHGIATVHHLPGVGQNLQDHPDFVFGYMSTIPISTAFRSSAAAAVAGHRPVPARTHRADDVELRRMRRLPENPARSRLPDIQLHFGMALADDHGRKRHRGTGFTCHVCLLRPKSRGEVTIGSADPFAPPVIDPNFFGEADDLETMVRASRPRGG
jgi:choline dehydrogenase-like flavoprotein